MSDPELESETDSEAVSDPFSTIFERARVANWKIERIPDPSSEFEEMATLYIPNGSRQRRLALSLHRLQLLEKTAFEEYGALGNYHAIGRRDGTFSEILLRHDGTRKTTRGEVERIPGIKYSFWERNQESLPGLDDYGPDGDDRYLSWRGVGKDGHWGEWRASPGQERRPQSGGSRVRLKVKSPDGSSEIEISHATNEFRALSSFRYAMGYDEWFAETLSRGAEVLTLKLWGDPKERHDDALYRLEAVGRAFLFDLVLNYDVRLQFARLGDERRVLRAPESLTESEPRYPRQRYAPEALDLYDYARSAVRMPLLQFLAYYQVLEFFFPNYFEREILDRLRHSLSEPRFNPHDDSNLQSILQIANPKGRVQVGERDQLRAVVSAIVDTETLKAFLDSDDFRREALTMKNSISGVKALALDQRADPLIDQVASRVYDLRCRVVHTKNSAGQDGANVDLLLPTSEEARRLDSDVELVKFLAEKALIASSVPL